MADDFDGLRRDAIRELEDTIENLYCSALLFKKAGDHARAERVLSLARELAALLHPPPN